MSSPNSTRDINLAQRYVKMGSTLYVLERSLRGGWLASSVKCKYRIICWKRLRLILHIFLNPRSYTGSSLQYKSTLRSFTNAIYIKIPINTSNLDTVNAFQLSCGVACSFPFDA